jgi:hypothetical protein
MTADRSNPAFWHVVPSDDEWKGVTLSTMERLDHRLQPICRSCWHTGGIMTPAEIAELFEVPMDMPLLTIQRMLRCAACGLPAGYLHQHNPLIRPHS